MNSRHANIETSEATAYIKSLRAPEKKRFANNYLQWIRSGRVGASPTRDGLGATEANAVAANLDSLA